MRKAVLVLWLAAVLLGMLLAGVACEDARGETVGPASETESAETESAGTSGEASLSWGDPASLAWAQRTGLIEHRGLYDGDGDISDTSNAFLYLSLAARNAPSEAVRARVLAHLRNFIAGGREPQFTAGPFWYYAWTSLGITVCRYTPAVWESLSAEEREKLDLIMECYAVATAFVSDDENHYQTGVTLTGNHDKTWNPNHRMAMTLPIVAATVYFSADGADGAAYLNELFLHFDYDRFLGKFDEYGFVRAKAAWTTEGYVFADGTRAPGARELLCEGGEAYVARLDAGGSGIGLAPGDGLGSGVGVKGNVFRYFGIPLTDLSGIVEHLYFYNYSGGAVISDTGSLTGGRDEAGRPRAYILDGTRSPVEGQQGMMREFVAWDGAGIRSTTTYCTHDLMLVVSSLAVLRELGVYEPEGDLLRQIWVGNTDLIYKYAHGYRGYSMGKSYDHREGPVTSSYTLWKTYWLEAYGDAFRIDE